MNRFFSTAIKEALVLTLVISACSPGNMDSSCRDNLARPNNGFEDDALEGWVNLGNSYTDSNAFTGRQSLKISGGEGGVQRFFRASPGDRFTLTLYLKKEGNPTWAGFGVDFQDLQGVTIAEYAFTPEITGEYKQYQMTRQAPDSAVQVEIWIYQKGNEASLYADNVCFLLEEIE